MVPLELLAPARTADIGIAAIRCGADAVYIGGPAFGARSAAGNSLEDIRRLCEFAAGFAARIYVTVNTLARNEAEREEVVGMMREMKDIGIGAFIIQDCTLLPLLRREGPWKEEFHASTQCAIRTPRRARELADMGFTRLILERQLSLEEIRAIRNAIPADVQLEFFVHGALCVCYSGDCYLSEYLTGRSANRGECAQPCRSTWDLVDGDKRILVKNKPLLSLKDLSLIVRLRDLADEGIVSFKIEGRLKNESYVKNVVRAYSDALDKVVGASSGKFCRASFGKVSGGFAPDTGKTFNRSYTDLYVDGVRGQWNSTDAAGGLGEYLGTVESSLGRSFILNSDKLSDLHNGDGLCYVGRNGDVCGFRIETVQGSKIVTREECRLEKGEKLWRNSDVEFERNLQKNMPRRLLRATISLEFSAAGLKVRAEREDGTSCCAEYGTKGLPAAENRDRMISMLHSQLEKVSGDILFTLGDVIAGDNASLPLLGASFLNSIRRDVAGKLSVLPPVPRNRASSSPDEAVRRSGDDKSVSPSGGQLTHPRREGELMRSRYCIRAELGICLKSAAAKQPAKALFLRNSKTLLPLRFDCAACEMVVKRPAGK